MRANELITLTDTLALRRSEVDLMFYDALLFTDEGTSSTNRH